MTHDARAHLVEFIRQVQDEYGASDLGAIAAAVSPAGFPLEGLRFGDPTPEQIADGILTGESAAPTTRGTD